MQKTAMTVETKGGKQGKWWEKEKKRERQERERALECVERLAVVVRHLPSVCVWAG